MQEIFLSDSPLEMKGLVLRLIEKISLNIIKCMEQGGEVIIVKSNHCGQITTEILSAIQIGLRTNITPDPKTNLYLLRKNDGGLL